MTKSMRQGQKRDTAKDRSSARFAKALCPAPQIAQPPLKPVRLRHRQKCEQRWAARYAWSSIRTAQMAQPRRPDQRHHHAASTIWPRSVLTAPRPQTHWARATSRQAAAGKAHRAAHQEPATALASGIPPWRKRANGSKPPKTGRRLAHFFVLRCTATTSLPRWPIGATRNCETVAA